VIRFFRAVALIRLILEKQRETLFKHCSNTVQTVLDMEMDMEMEKDTKNQSASAEWFGASDSLSLIVCFQPNPWKLNLPKITEIEVKIGINCQG
jgi:hypothetical protein